MTGRERAIAKLINTENVSKATLGTSDRRGTAHLDFLECVDVDSVVLNLTEKN